MASVSRRVAGPVREDGLADAPDLVVRHVLEPGPRDGLDGREDAPHEVGPAGPHVLVGRVDERLEGDAKRVLARHVTPPELLQRVAGVLRARALRVVVRFLVTAARDVVLEEPADPRLLVE